MPDNIPSSACAAYNASKKEEAEKELQRREREFDKRALLEIIDQLRLQNAQLEKQNKESKIELEKSHKQNKTMMIWTIICAVAAVGSLIAAIVIAIVK